jgi:hypothetical protein
MWVTLIVKKNELVTGAVTGVGRVVVRNTGGIQLEGLEMER